MFKGRKISRRLLSVVIALLVVSVGAALAFPRLRRRATYRVRHTWLLLNGHLVDVGGFRLNFRCEGSGTPTVILESGLAQPMETWGQVPTEVAKYTRVCTYDRAGLGDSDAGPAPRTSQRMVVELHALLTRAKISGPYILVGHSFGGLNVRLYANDYPSEVKGIVLLNASTEDQHSRFAALLSPSSRDAFLRKEQNNFERADIAASSEEVRNIATAPDVPTDVLTSPIEGTLDISKRAELEKAWNEMQARLASRFPHGHQILVPNSRHFIQRDQPDVVVKAIREVMTGP